MESFTLNTSKMLKSKQSKQSKYHNKWKPCELMVLYEMYPTYRAEDLLPCLPERNLHTIRRKSSVLGIKSTHNKGKFVKGYANGYWSKDNPPPSLAKAIKAWRNKPKKPYPRKYYNKTLNTYLAELEDGRRIQYSRYMYAKYYPQQDITNKVIVHVNGDKSDFTKDNLVAIDREDIATYQTIGFGNHYTKMATALTYKIKRTINQKK